MTAKDLKHGMVITEKELIEVLESVGSKVCMFIDGNNLGDLLVQTGFAADHNYDGAETYTISKW